MATLYLERDTQLVADPHKATDTLRKSATTSPNEAAQRFDKRVDRIGWLRASGGRHGLWREHRDVAYGINALPGPNDEPAAVKAVNVDRGTTARQRFRRSEARSEGLEPPTF